MEQSSLRSKTPEALRTQGRLFQRRGGVHVYQALAYHTHAKAIRTRRIITCEVIGLVSDPCAGIWLLLIDRCSGPT
jgi:hypothetical protein